MIDHLDALLVRLLTTHNPPGLAAGQIGFTAPDQDWRNLVAGMVGIALNVYLVELFDDAQRRSNERFEQLGTNGDIERTRAPGRLNCRYLISAWSPAKANPLVDPAVEEAVLLFQVAQLLLDKLPLDAAAIYAPGSPPAGFPDEMLDPPLPVVVAPSEPFGKLGDFWMRMDTVWKPVLEVVVTMPVPHARLPAGPPVTTLLAEYGTVGHPALEERIAIGGVVRLSGSGTPVPAAWVRVVELDQRATTNAAGQFVFAGIGRGSYTLEAGAPGHASATRSVDVPSLSGEYDVTLA